MSALTLDNPAAVAEAGERIYAEQFRQAYEHDFAGQFAAIDVRSQRAVVGTYAEDAIEQALSRFDAPLLHLVRIGSESAFGVSFLEA